MQSRAIDFNPQAAPAFLLPLPGMLFADRADRFAELAARHGLGDWLAFLGQLTRAQHAALQALPLLPLPDAATLAQARKHAMPPLNAGAPARPAVWRAVLRQLAAALDGAAPEAARIVLVGLAAADDSRLEALADALVAGEPEADDLAALPFVAAALQVVFTRLASELDPGQLQPLDARALCPCCGSPPVASIVRVGTTIDRLRYLHCSLCNSEWHLPRATCTACGSDEALALLEPEGGQGAVRAEACDACRSYLKIVDQQKDAGVDPVADDLATLSLDLLVDAAGYARSGQNLLLIGGNA